LEVRLTTGENEGKKERKNETTVADSQIAVVLYIDGTTLDVFDKSRKRGEHSYFCGSGDECKVECFTCVKNKRRGFLKKTNDWRLISLNACRGRILA